MLGKSTLLYSTIFLIDFTNTITMTTVLCRITCQIHSKKWGVRRCMIWSISEQSYLHLLFVSADKNAKNKVCKEVYIANPKGKNEIKIKTLKFNFKCPRRKERKKKGDLNPIF